MGELIHWKAKGRPIITEKVDPDLHRRMDKLWSEVAGYDKADACCCLIQAISIFLRHYPEESRDAAHHIVIENLRANLSRYKRFSG